MKRILSISSVFIGLVIGAGFASGKEIFNFFCLPSRTDFTGIVLATISFGAICFIIMHLSQKCCSKTFDQLIEHLCNSFAPAIKLFMLAFMFSGFFIMFSACGVLAKETFSLSPQWGIWFLALMCFVVFSFDVKGLVAINTVLVPIMLAGMTYVCLSAGLAALPVFSAFESIKTNPLISALCYVSYNTITAGAVLVPLSNAATRKQIICASTVSSFILGITIFIAWLCMNHFFKGLADSEMPLLELASRDGDFSKKCYTVVLFMALCTTAVSYGFGILSKFRFKTRAYRIGASAILCLLAIPLASLGFSTLVANLYSAFGYMGLFWTAFIIIKYLKS
ncbi:MAG: hypothetical protein IJN96_08370 [Clostridia bacterium]|nr:hypothetical protein [Clostridia bacterium]